MLAIVFATGAPCASARAERLPVQVFTAANGLLPSELVYSIHQDHSGYFWFLTGGGYAFFDGNRMTRVRFPGLEETTRIKAIVVTRSGELIIGTDRGGILRYTWETVELDDEGGNAALVKDPEAAARQFRIPLDGSLAADTIVDLIETRSGALWCHTRAGLFRLERRHETWTVVEVVSDLPSQHWNATRISTMFEDDDGTLWVSHARGLLRVRPDGRRVHYNRDHGLRDVEIEVVFRGQDRRLWIASEKHLQRVATSPDGDEFVVERSYSRADGLPSSQITTVAQSTDGRIWVGTGNGLAELRARSNGDYEVWRVHRRAHGLPDNAVFALACDRSNNLWVGTEAGGVARVVLDGFISFDERDGLDHARIATVVEDLAGHLCVVSSNGAFHYLEGERFVPVRPAVPPDVTDFGWGWNQIHFQDRRGSWWIPTTTGVYRLGPVSHPAELAAAPIIAHYGVADGLANDEIFRLFGDRDGDVWIATIGPKLDLLSRWRSADGTLEHFGIADGLPPEAVTILGEDAQGQLWLGFYEGSLGRFRAGKFELLLEKSPKRNMARSLFTDNAGRLWASFRLGGALRIDDPLADELSPIEYTRAEGLRSNSINCVSEDAWGRMYFGHPAGLDRLDATTGQFTYFSASDGLAASALNGFHRTDSGALWIATLTGLSKFLPEKPRHDPAPRAELRGLRVHGQRRSLTALVERGAPALALGVAPGEIRIEYGAIDFRIGERLRYQYRLHGADSDWCAPTEARSVLYAHLAPGEYSFQVRAVNLAGQTSPELAGFAFSIQPPLWQRPWMSGSIIALAGASLYLLFRLRTSALRTSEARLALKVAEQTHELRASARELEEANSTLERRVEAGVAALRAAERMAAYGEMVAGVAHEVRQPIFAIQASSYVLGKKLAPEPELANQLRTLDFETKRMGRLMEDLLEFARPGELFRSACAVSALLDEAAVIHRSEHGEHAAEVIVDCEAGLPTIAVDQQRIVQVLVNLLENALKHATGATRLVLRARVEPTGPDRPQHVRLEVEDNGAGIAADALPRIFDPFFTTGRGTGLGLAIVARIIGAHDGVITAKSELGRGTTFLIKLPITSV
ncbi:MAG: two-component regulator propeller domain-containing protein [Planctomycetota bacterium]